MGRTVGTPNKITTEVRGKLESLIEGLVDSIYIEELTPNQRIKMLQIALQYTLPRLQAMVVKNEFETESQKIEVEIVNTFDDVKS